MDSATENSQRNDEDHDVIGLRDEAGKETETEQRTSRRQPVASQHRHHPPPPPPPRRRRLSGCFLAFLCFIGAAVLAVALIGLIVVGFVEDSSLLSGPRLPKVREVPIQGDLTAPEKIAVINVKGVIVSSAHLDAASAQVIIRQLTRARKDPKVVAVVLDMNTPGGEVTASDEIYHHVRNVRAAGKPVITCMRSVGASGGYMVAAGTDHIIAHRLTMTGSIGVIIGTLNYAELFKKIGLDAEIYKSGRMKDMLNGARQRTELEKRYVDNLVESTFQEFVAVVAENRPRFSSRDAVLNAPFADGRILLGQQAYDAGLVDQLGYFEHALQKAKELAGAPAAAVVRYRREIGIGDLLLSFGSRSRSGLRNLLPPEQRLVLPGRLYYLMPAVVEQ